MPHVTHPMGWGACFTIVLFGGGFVLPARTDGKDVYILPNHLKNFRILQTIYFFSFHALIKV